jgi:hypothetical protein
MMRWLKFCWYLDATGRHGAAAKAMAQEGIRWMPRALLRGYQEDAPDNLRSFVLQTTNDLGLTPDPLGLACARFSIVIGSFMLHGNKGLPKSKAEAAMRKRSASGRRFLGQSIPTPPKASIT